MELQIAGNLKKATDNDWLKVDLKAGQIYGISVKARVSSEGTLLDPMLTLYDQNGALIISNDDGGVETEPYIEFTPANDQSFYVSVSSYGADETGLGTYLLEVNDLGLAQSDDFTSDAVTKSILIFDERTNLASVNGSLEFLGDVDWHAVDLTGRNTYIIDVSGHGEAALEDPYLKVFDVDGNLVVSNDDGGTDSNARLRFSPDEDETYFIESSGYNNSYAGDYTVNLTEIDTAKDIPNDASTTTTIVVEESFAGLLEFEGDRDWIKVGLVGGSVYNVTLEGDQIPSGEEQILPLEDPHLRLFDGRGNLIAENDDLEGRNSGLINLSVDETGTYFFSAGAYGDSGVGSYELFLDESIMRVHVVPNDITTTFSLNDNEIFTNTLEAFGDRDWVEVALGSGQTYEIDLFGSGENPVGDTFLRLYDENGWWVDENDDGPVNADSKLNYSPTVSGSYFIEVASFNDEFTGTYSLSYNESKNIDDFPLGLDTDVALNEQSIQEGTINMVGDEDYFKFTTNANTIYEFTLESSNSDTPLEDPLLTIVDQSGDILTVNDDYEGTLNSKIKFVSDATSTVYLVASSYDEIGDYVLGSVLIAEGFFDDHLNDFTTTSRLTLNEKMAGDLENFDEIDMFVVNLEGGKTYDFRVFASASDGGTLADPILTLYNQNENWLDYNDDTFGYDPFIGGFVAGYSGDHYLEVKRYNDAGTYNVLAQEGPALIDDHLNDFKTTSRLTLNEQMSGDLENFDEIDMFVVNLEGGQTYDFRVLTSASDGGTFS